MVAHVNQPHISTLRDLKAFGRVVAYGEVSSEPNHDEPASGPNFSIDGYSTGTLQTGSLII